MTPAEGSRPFSGRVALVTGASRGIGRAVALRLAADGAAVAVTARTFASAPDAPLPGSLEETVAAIAALGGIGLAVPADLTDEADRASIVPEVTAALGPIDILVNNAAAAIYAPVADMPLRHRRLLFEVNVHAPVDLAQGVLPSMMERGSGWIVNLSSATADREVGPPFPTRAVAVVPYGASKAALERFTVGLAAEVSAHGIAVNAVAPVTGVRTEGADALVGDLVATEGFEPIEHMVDAVAYLAGCDPTECTGQVWRSQTLLRSLGRLP